MKNGQITLYDKIWFTGLFIMVSPAILLAGITMYVIVITDKLMGQDTMIGMRGTFGKGNRFQ